MKYFITKDSNGYVLSISHTNTRLDTIELDLSKYDLNGLKKFAYKVGKDELIFDNNRYQELLKEEQKKADAKECKELRKLLTDSDYLVDRTFEEVMALTNPVTFISETIKILVKYNTKYKDTIANRKAWRKRIEELEK